MMSFKCDVCSLDLGCAEPNSALVKQPVPKKQLGCNLYGIGNDDGWPHGHRGGR